MNYKLFLIALTCGIVGITVVVAPALIYTELTTGDIARLTDEQRYTLDKIKNNVLLLSRYDDRETILTDDKISVQIFEYFINEGITLCNNADGPFCYDFYDKPLVDIYNSTITDKYNDIVDRNPKPASALGKLFGDLFGNMLVYAQLQGVITMPSPDTYGDILFLGANDTLGDHECYRAIEIGVIQLNSSKLEECENRPPVEGDLIAPTFTA